MKRFAQDHTARKQPSRIPHVLLFSVAPKLCVSASLISKHGGGEVGRGREHPFSGWSGAAEAKPGLLGRCVPLGAKETNDRATGSPSCPFPTPWAAC